MSLFYEEVRTATSFSAGPAVRNLTVGTLYDVEIDVTSAQS